jgi:sec-independent protein translocase protein TatA
MFRNGLQPAHVIIVLVLVVLLFGAKRLPDVAKSVGQSLKIFKSEIKDLKDDPSTTSAGHPAAPPAQAPADTATVVPQPPVAPTPAPRADAPAPGPNTDAGSGTPGPVA